MFVEAIRKIFNAVIEDNLEGISKNLVGLLREQNDVMIKEAVNQYTQEMKHKWPSYSKAESVHKEIQVSLKAELKERLYDIEGQKNSLLYLFEVKTERAFQSISEEKANDQLLKLNSTIESNYTNRSYFVIGGSDRFRADMDSLEDRYRQCVNLGPKAIIVWENYKETLLNKRQTIQTKENILHQEMESTRRREQARKERERIIAERNRQAERREEMNRRQEYEQRRRNEEMNENAMNIVAGIAEIGLRLLFNSLTR
ncbi:uncharacterized protein LOC132754990 isoform X2 [Ruditapes philippinarum]|uniref:uncharacterized protein LOC132754990 isoform X2 n=1 Tax=Ruditapes philippinarum TaxID=129788 RepID=UPI00295AA8AD|nr:uncharacterized protein LOC132754990 isoform X2 [Ruditapes philippinarum]